MLITEEYKELQKKLHASNQSYGISGQKWAQHILRIAEQSGTKEILDYGCGRQTLQKQIPFPITNYDPCIEGMDTTPEPHDIVVCTDVMEHIEPDCLGHVLDELKRLTKKVLFCSVAMRPAVKFLADGRNAHLIQENIHWWITKFTERFELQSLQNFGGEFVVICTPLEKENDS